MPEPTEPRAIVVRSPAPMDRAQLLRTRLKANDARLRDALQELNRAAHELTPGAVVSRRPFQYVLGAFALGLLIGFMTRTYPTNPHHRGG